MKKQLDIPEELKDPGLPTGTFSHSQYSKFKTCGCSYEFKYIKGLKSPPSVSMFKGTCVHAGVEKALLYLIETKTYPALSDMEQVVIDTFESRKSEVEDWGEEKPAVIKEATLKLYNKYHLENLSQLHPVAVEEGFAQRIGTVPMTGYIDLVDRFGGFGEIKSDSPEVIVDLKTSSAKWSADEVKKDTQLTLYSIVRKTPFVRIDNLVTLKGGPVLHRLESTRDAPAGKIFIEDLEETADFVKKGIFPKVSIDNWACSEKWCSYWKQCRGK